MFKNYFKIAWRKLLKDRQFSILNLIGLSTSLACAFLIYLWVNDELSIDKFHKKNAQLYRVLYNLNLENEILTLEQTPSPLAEALVLEMPEIEKAVSVNYFMDWFVGKGVLSHGEKSIKAQGIFASKDYFNVFSYKLLEGDKDLVLAAKNGVLISDRLAKKLFDDTDNLIGKPLEWNHRMKFNEPLVVSGVFESPSTNSSYEFDVIFNYNLLLEGEKSAQSWTSTYSDTYLVLKQGTDVAQFNKKIENFSKSKDPANSICTLFIEPFADKYLYGNFKNGVQSGGRIEYVKLFSFIALFILLIACINFMNLTTAQSSRKTKEIGVRKTLGASRNSLIFQFFGESLLMTFLASIFSIAFVSLFLPQFNEISGKQIVLNFNSNTVFAISVIVLLTAFISGFYPAIYLSSFNPIAILKGKLRATFGESFVRKGLVVFQFGISIVFVVGFFVIKKQIELTQTKNLGYDRNNIITFKREGAFPEKSEAFLSEIRKISGIEKVTAMPLSILDGTDRQGGFSWRGQQADESYIFKSPRVSYDAIETFGMKILAGRSFSREFKDDGTKIILNESAVKKMDLKDPIGKTIKTGNFESQIIGVVNDFQYGSIHQKIEPLVFRFRDEAMGENVMVKIKAGTETASITQIQKLYEDFHPKYAFEYSFLDEDYQKLYASEQRIGILSNFFTALAILIACLGLFGLATFTAEQRVKEIGIRKVLGASVLQITTLLSKDFLKLVVIAFVIASPIAYYFMDKWLADFAYRITISWWIFALAGISAVLIALITVSWQSIKAAVANPVKSLRSE